MPPSGVEKKITKKYALINVITGGAFVALFVVFRLQIIPAYHRGFYCNDDSITKPYIEQAISLGILVGVSVPLVIIVVMLCELFKTCKKNEEKCVTELWNMPEYLFRFLSRLGLIIVGTLMTLIIIEFAKRMTGRLRPHFISVCKPDYSKFNCTDGYITNYVCTGTDKEAIEKARLSFPSGHSGMAGFVTLTIALYIEYTIKSEEFCLLKQFIQFVFMCIGLACALTRISDYYHHWSDALVGLLIGYILAVYTIYGMIRLNVEETENEGCRCQDSRAGEERISLSNVQNGDAAV